MNQIGDTVTGIVELIPIHQNALRILDEDSGVKKSWHLLCNLFHHQSIGGDVKSSLTKFGSYGFMSALLATQIAAYPQLFSEKSVHKTSKLKVAGKK